MKPRMRFSRPSCLEHFDFAIGESDGWAAPDHLATVSRCGR
jgi:hypothetical protein